MCAGGPSNSTRCYRSAALTLPEFEGPRYQRIGHIRKLMSEGILASDLRRIARASADETMTLSAAE